MRPTVAFVGHNVKLPLLASPVGLCQFGGWAQDKSRLVHGSRKQQSVIIPAGRSATHNCCDTIACDQVFDPRLLIKGKVNIVLLADVIHQQARHGFVLPAPLARFEGLGSAALYLAQNKDKRRRTAAASKRKRKA